jgi:hypothetical protein
MMAAAAEKWCNQSIIWLPQSGNIWENYTIKRRFVYISVVLMAVVGVNEVSLTIMMEKELHLVLAY